jgi:hypothetical protein
MFHQMMFAISIFDSVSSFAFLLGSLPVPKSTAMYGARGNETTCKLQGEACRCSVMCVHGSPNTCKLIRSLAILKKNVTAFSGPAKDGYSRSGKYPCTTMWLYQCISY